MSRDGALDPFNGLHLLDLCSTHSSARIHPRSSSFVITNDREVGRAPLNELTGAPLRPRSRAPRVLSALLQERTEDTRVAVGPEIVRTGGKDYVPSSIDDQ